MQCAEVYQVILKISISDVPLFINGQLRQHEDVMNVDKSMKLHDFILSFLLIRKQVLVEHLFRINCKVLKFFDFKT